MSIHEMQALQAYITDWAGGNADIPSDAALRGLSAKVDAATERVFAQVEETFLGTDELEGIVHTFETAPRTAGRFSQDKVLLEDVSSLEQMLGLKSYLTRHQIRRVHTCYLSSTHNDYVPLEVRPVRGGYASLMHVRLGTTRGAHKAPNYADWAQNDPWLDVSQRPFISPLEALEAVRQFDRSGATILKGNAFECEWIDPKWRYGEEMGCVELKGQRGHVRKKQMSAGLNLAHLVEEFSDVSDPLALDIDICVPTNYEDYVDEGYGDNRQLNVNIGDLLRAVRTSFRTREESSLDDLMFRLVVGKFATPSSDELKRLFSQAFPLED